MDKIKLAQRTIALLSSMIESGESHTSRSREMKDNALNGLEQLRLGDVVKCVYVVTERDDYGRQLFREVFLNKEQATEYLNLDGLKEDNINEINEIEFD